MKCEFCQLSSFFSISIWCLSAKCWILLKLLRNNPGFYQDFEVKESDVEGPEPFPVVITDEPTHKVWFHADDVFEEPECVINLHLFRFFRVLKNFFLNFTKLFDLKKNLLRELRILITTWK